MKPIRVAIYVRVSLKKSDQKSPASQLRECEELCERKGYVVVARCIETGKSAYRKKAKRPQWDKAMEMIERKQADIILVWKIDRSYRDGIEFNAVVGRLLVVKGNIESVMEPWIDTTTAQGRSNLSAIAYQAEMESESRAMQAKAFHRYRIAGDETNGKAGTPGGVRPFGYCRKGKGSLVIDKTEAKTLRDAAAIVTSGKSLSKFVRETKPVKRIADDEWEAFGYRGLRNALQNPTTYGMRRSPTGELIEGTWEPILPLETLDAIGAVFGARDIPPTNKVQHLLCGLIVCGKCEGRGFMSRFHQRQQGRRYECANCGNSVSEANADGYVISQMWDIVTPEVWQSWRIEGHGWDQTVLDRIRMRREKIDLKMLAGDYDDDMSRYETLDTNLRAQEELAMSGEPLDLPDTDDPRADWEFLSLIDQRKIVRQAFVSIRLVSQNGSKNIASRIEVK